MPNALAVQLDAIARTFARDIVTALRESGYLAARPDTSAAPSRRRGRGRPRKDGSDLRSGAADATAVDVASIVAFVRRNPGCGGMAIRRALKLPLSAWLRAVQHCRAERLVRMEGRTKAARYWVS